MGLSIQWRGWLGCLWFLTIMDASAGHMVHRFSFHWSKDPGAGFPGPMVGSHVAL